MIVARNNHIRDILHSHLYSKLNFHALKYFMNFSLYIAAWEMKILNKSNTLTSAEPIKRTLIIKNWENHFRNMGTKFSQSNKSRKFFGSIIQGLIITASNSPTEYLLDALILSNLERRTWLWWKSNGTCCFVYFFFRQNLRWWRRHHVLNYHRLCISFRSLKRTTLQTHFLQ